MAITKHDQPVYTIACSNTHCLSLSDGTPATDDNGHTHYFGNPADAANWATTNGWMASPEGPALCPPCATDARHRAETHESLAASLRLVYGTNALT